MLLCLQMGSWVHIQSIEREIRGEQLKLSSEYLKFIYLLGCSFDESDRHQWPTSSGNRVHLTLRIRLPIQDRPVYCLTSA